MGRISVSTKGKTSPIMCADCGRRVAKYRATYVLWGNAPPARVYLCALCKVEGEKDGRVTECSRLPMLS
jgi:DNA-directed RNA polymerase subunit RPC12/RpoP